MSRFDYLTVQEFADRAGCSSSTIRRRLAVGQIKGLRVKCVYCPFLRKCKRGNCGRVLLVGEFQGLKVAFTGYRGKF